MVSLATSKGIIQCILQGIDQQACGQYDDDKDAPKLPDDFTVGTSQKYCNL